MKQNGFFDDALRLSLFPYFLTHHAIAWYDRLPRNSIHSFDDIMRKFLSKYFPPSMDTINVVSRGTFMQKTQEECYELIENMTAHHNHWDTLAIRDETSRNISSTSSTESPEVVRQLEMMNKNFSKMMRQFQMVKAVGQFMKMNSTSSSGTGSLPSNIVPNPREDLKAITTRSSVTLVGPSVSPPPLSKEVDREPETITDHVLTESTNNFPPLVVQPSLASTSFSTISSSKMPRVTKDTQFLNPNEVVPPESNEQQRLLRISLRICGTIVESLPMARSAPKTGRALIDVYGEEEADHERYRCGSDPGQGRLRRRLAYG
nr:ATPase subunit 4, mitochondrial [Tanacetum cinerariifolium]